MSALKLKTPYDARIEESLFENIQHKWTSAETVNYCLKWEFYYDEKICKKITEKIGPFVIDLSKRFKIDVAKILVAGGYVAYMMNKTNTYQDIDLFIPVENLVSYSDVISKLKEFGFTTNNTYDGQLPTQLLESLKYGNYNLIFFKVDDEKDLVKAHIEILKSFDLAICRAGHSFALSDENTPLIDYEWYGDLKLAQTETRINRKIKYAKRRNDDREIRMPRYATRLIEKLLMKNNIETVKSFI